MNILLIGLLRYFNIGTMKQLLFLRTKNKKRSCSLWHPFGTPEGVNKYVFEKIACQRQVF